MNLGIFANADNTADSVVWGPLLLFCRRHAMCAHRRLMCHCEQLRESVHTVQRTGKTKAWNELPTDVFRLRMQIIGTRRLRNHTYLSAREQRAPVFWYELHSSPSFCISSSSTIPARLFSGALSVHCKCQISIQCLRCDVQLAPPRGRQWIFVSCRIVLIVRCGEPFLENPPSTSASSCETWSRSNVSVLMDTQMQLRILKHAQVETCHSDMNWRKVLDKDCGRTLEQLFGATRHLVISLICWPANLIIFHSWDQLLCHLTEHFIQSNRLFLLRKTLQTPDNGVQNQKLATVQAQSTPTQSVPDEQGHVHILQSLQVLPGQNIHQHKANLQKTNS